MLSEASHFGAQILKNIKRRSLINLMAQIIPFHYATPRISDILNSKSCSRFDISCFTIYSYNTIVKYLIQLFRNEPEADVLMCVDHLPGMCIFFSHKQKVCNKYAAILTLVTAFFFFNEPLFTSPAVLSALLLLIMWQFRYPVSLWPNKSGATPIIMHLCQENCVNQMLWARNSCPKTNIMAVRGKNTSIVPSSSRMFACTPICSGNNMVYRITYAIVWYFTTPSALYL